MAPPLPRACPRALEGRPSGRARLAAWAHPGLKARLLWPLTSAETSGARAAAPGGPGEQNLPRTAAPHLHIQPPRLPVRWLPSGEAPPGPSAASPVPTGSAQAGPAEGAVASHRAEPPLPVPLHRVPGAAGPAAGQVAGPPPPGPGDAETAGGGPACAEPRPACCSLRGGSSACRKPALRFWNGAGLCLPPRGQRPLWGAPGCFSYDE